eukprot:gb/GECH01008566.1/.p1 GENE.gb/GECH01008566.1/~~gb/GECH01008566.1/.p1  ORF type:complete len:223 (+),score=32.33 gb/GECH01008566.1/:1-669(+)
MFFLRYAITYSEQGEPDTVTEVEPYPWRTRRGCELGGDLSSSMPPVPSVSSIHKHLVEASEKPEMCNKFYFRLRGLEVNETTLGPKHNHWSKFDEIILQQKQYKLLRSVERNKESIGQQHTDASDNIDSIVKDVSRVIKGEPLKSGFTFIVKLHIQLRKGTSPHITKKLNESIKQQQEQPIQIIRNPTVNNRIQDGYLKRSLLAGDGQSIAQSVSCVRMRAI